MDFYRNFYLFQSKVLGFFLCLFSGQKVFANLDKSLIKCFADPFTSITAVVSSANWINFVSFCLIVIPLIFGSALMATAITSTASMNTKGDRELPYRIHLVTGKYCEVLPQFIAFRRVCIRRKYKWQVACSTVSHEKALHNYFIPCLNLRKTYGNFGKSSEISVNFRKLWKRFKPVFEELKRFIKLLENFGNSSKNVFQMFLWFF